MTSKRNIIIIAAAAVILAGGAAAVVLTNSAKSSSESVLALAQRYLSEQKYEQAVIEYQKILDIDPMNTEAYLGLAQAYLGMGDTEGAIAALRRGYEATGDEGLLAKLNSLLPPEGTQESPAEQQETAELTANVTVDDGVRQMYALVRQECYNADGALTSYYEANDDGTITYCYLESDGWISLKIIYSMNRYGRKDKELSKTYYNDDGTIMLEYIYNEYHDVVQLNSSSTNETWEYTYDDNGNKISALCTRDSHTDDRFYVAPEYDKHIISTSEYTYETTCDEQGRVVNLKTFVDGELSEEETFEYAPDTGIMTRYYSVNASNTFEGKYNNRGDMLSSDIVQSAVGVSSPTEFHYTFDENGNPISADLYKNGNQTGTYKYEWQVL